MQFYSFSEELLGGIVMRETFDLFIIKTVRYTHNIRIIRKRKHVVTISLIFTLILILLILVLGFTTLDIFTFFLGLFQSLGRVLIAYAVALLIALSMILIISATSSSIESVIIPVLDALQSFPVFAIFPLLIVWFGKSSLDIIIILVLEMIWPIIFTLLSGQKQIKRDVLEAAEIFGATGIKNLFYVILPLLFPSIITGSIVAWGEAWETIIAAEIIVSVPGVGSYLSLAGQNNQMSVLIIGIILLLLILFMLNKYIWLPLLNLSTKYQE